MNISIIPIKYANSFLSGDQVREGGNKESMYPIAFYSYVIRTAERSILVDAGCETMPGFDMRNFISPIEGLQKAGISPNEITDVILTHAHHDHIECVKYFPHATVHIQRDELERGKKYIPSDFTVNAFDEAFCVCEGVDIIKIGGHSVGSCIVQVAGEGTTYIIAGDECYQRSCLNARIPVGSSCNPQKSRAFVEEYSSDKYTVLLMHDD